MSTQAFYDNYIREYARQSQKGKYSYKPMLITVSETENGKDWAYLATTYLDEKEARKEAQFESTITRTLWRVAVGNHTIALYLNGEEIKEENNG